MLKEPLRWGQWVEAFAFDTWDGKDWVETARGTTIGWKKLLRFPAVTAEKVRVRILKTRGGPTIFAPDGFGLYLDPGR
jgi:alpha-L-fucosidase